MTRNECNWDPGCEQHPNPTPMPSNNMGPEGMDRLEVERRRMVVVHQLREQGGQMSHQRTREAMLQRWGHC